MKIKIIFALLILLAVFFYANAPTAFVTKAHCTINGKMPDLRCTHGAVFNVTSEQVCVSGYASDVRDVPQSLKDSVYEEYGIASHRPYEYEVDHFISLELGGSNDISNLWPEAAEPRPGYHEKDKVENYLHDQVCNHGMPLGEAQKEIKDWLVVYSTINGTK